MKPIEVFNAMDKSFMMIVLKSEKLIILFFINFKFSLS